jgi:hypothetical protein
MMRTSYKIFAKNRHRLFVHLDNGNTFGIDVYVQGEPTPQDIIGIFNNPEYRQRFILETEILNDYLSGLPYYNFDMTPIV